MSAKFIGAGSPLVDILGPVDDAFVESVGGEKGGMIMVDHLQLDEIINALPSKKVAPGGSASNTLIGLMKLGESGAFLGKVGTDERGNYFVNAFEKSGGSTHAFKSCEQTPTGTCISLVTPDTQRTLRTHLGAAAALTVDEVSKADFEGCTHAHLEGYMLFNYDLVIKTLHAAKEAGCTVSLDLAAFEVVQANSEVLAEILDQYVDMVFANEDEAKAWCDSDDPQVALDSLSKYCDVVAVKLGPEGAWVRKADETVFVNSYKVEAVDTTGAGDLWASGFLYGLYNDYGLEKSAKLGAKTGSEVVQIMGAVIPEAGWDRIKTFLNEL
ncbi:adenosine kinase [Lentisphaera marina]|uniref:adenosine kinase n=1 Tax=Lentisphaera marina TaxID=1111041 RepID=UPI0023667363|nr:adenosine kinase [Lentisphaera marina]MDD7984227.1 adenosine kinase [Lentisphaera marina]